MYRFISYLKFLGSASNQHGVHSPFIYAFVTKGLYTKGNKQGSITENVLVKSIRYFSLKKVRIASDSNQLKVKLNSIFKDLEYDTLPCDLMYVEHPDDLLKNSDPKYIDNDSVLLVKDIYKSRSDTEKWIALKKLEQVTVTIDLYHCGIAFFRKEQAKEHFKIRI